MKKCVVILGAGASQPAGLPYLSQILSCPAAQEYLQSEELLRRFLETLYWHPTGLDSTTADKGPNIEQILTHLRDAELHDLPLPGANTIAARTYIRNCLYILIFKVLRHGSSARRHFNPLVELLDDRFDKIVWATLNWDCILDATLYYLYAPDQPRRQNPHLCFDIGGFKQPSDECNRWLLKLHGGINWWIEDNKLQYYQFGTSGANELGKKWDAIDVNSITNRPAILDPTYYKYRPTSATEKVVWIALAKQWEALKQELLSCDRIIVWGYSMPDSDSLLRTYLLSAHRVNSDVEFAIVDPWCEAQKKYLSLLGENRLTQIMPHSHAEFASAPGDYFNDAGFSI